MPTTERRKAPRRDEDVSSDEAGEIKDILHGLTGMLTIHMTKEEVDIADLGKRMDTYFHDLDAHTHVFHHNKVAEVIKEDEETHQFWHKLKSNAAEKAMIFVAGIVAMYLVSLIWLDFGNKLASQANPPQTIPASVQPQPVVIQVPPRPLNPPTVSSRQQDAPPLP